VTDKKWVCFEIGSPSPSGKTMTWAIRASADDTYLGYVTWSGPWRQYVFATTGNTIWNPDCLNEVSEFLRKATTEHREAKKK
jgi:hypothetical protein